MCSLANRKSMELGFRHEEEGRSRAAVRLPAERNTWGAGRPLVAPHCTRPNVQGAHHVQGLPRRR